MKNQKLALITVLVLILLASTLVLSGCGDSTKEYTMTYTDPDTYFAVALPFTPFGAEQPDYAYNMMGITETGVDVTFNGNEYSYVSHDIGNSDPDEGMYWDRTITFIGELSESKGTYTLSAPTKVTEELKYGTMFADYKEVWGEQGTYTEADDAGKAFLAAFSACTATTTDDAVTFTIG